MFILEDDCVPLPGVNEAVRRMQAAVAALPGVDVIAGHEPNSRYTFSEQVGGAVRIIKPPRGSIFTWYSPRGLPHAYDIISRMEVVTIMHRSHATNQRPAPPSTSRLVVM